MICRPQAFGGRLHSGRYFQLKANNANGGGGFGWFGGKAFFSFDVKAAAATECHLPGNSLLLTTRKKVRSRRGRSRRARGGTRTDRARFGRQSYRFNWGLNNLTRQSRTLG